jgi:hypothetical protein
MSIVTSEIFVRIAKKKKNQNDGKEKDEQTNTIDPRQIEKSSVNGPPIWMALNGQETS